MPLRMDYWWREWRWEPFEFLNFHQTCRSLAATGGAMKDHSPLDESVLGWDDRGLRQGERRGKGCYQDHLPSGG